MSVLGLSARVDSNSVRVSGGKGNAVILEVSKNCFDDKHFYQNTVVRSHTTKDGNLKTKMMVRKQDALTSICFYFRFNLIN